jgi:hypothetical protein
VVREGRRDVVAGQAVPGEVVPVRPGAPGRAVTVDSRAASESVHEAPTAA